ncbi:MAG: hypothetical protein ACK55Z_27100, partial [bacterium]
LYRRLLRIRTTAPNGRVLNGAVVDVQAPPGRAATFRIPPFFFVPRIHPDRIIENRNIISLRLIANRVAV